MFHFSQQCVSEALLHANMAERSGWLSVPSSSTLLAEWKLDSRSRIVGLNYPHHSLRLGQRAHSRTGYLRKIDASISIQKGVATLRETGHYPIVPVDAVPRSSVKILPRIESGCKNTEFCIIL